ncbi:MAG: hypothetical protein CL528_10030 [Aequorivita sp.]|nr:hypothetical protein [Aequorivita sp.]MBP42101.1 hypothetical protein [Aequorivita sp.]|tara:strand:+ start:2278 stop:3132 length:855 start_codon:yes stop_codon:yes gene_type:complete
MLILQDKYGQLCNRLWAFAPFISEAFENNHKLIILHFYDYYQYFENLKIYDNITFIENKKISNIYKILIRLLDRIPTRILSYLGIILKTEICVTKIKLENRLVVINGWKHRKPPNQLKIAQIQKIFRPKSIYTKKVDEVFISKRKSFDLIIGVHIRRGDYKEFKNGIYYYSDSIIINFLNQIKNEFGQKKKIAFLLCSDEKINLEMYRDFSVFQINNASLIEDLYGLSKCDYIIGPPSTFSMWASFYGQKPLFFIKMPNMLLKIKDFSVIISQNKFENGNIFSH